MNITYSPYTAMTSYVVNSQVVSNHLKFGNVALSYNDAVAARGRRFKYRLPSPSNKGPDYIEGTGTVKEVIEEELDEYTCKPKRICLVLDVPDQGILSLANYFKFWGELSSNTKKNWRGQLSGSFTYDFKDLD